MDDIVASASGSGSLEVADGALTSISALAQVATLLELAGGKGIGRDETPFEYFRGTYAIGGGNARTSDLTLHSADLDLDGEGRLGLDASMDLAVVARFSEEATRGMAEKNSRVESFTDPSGRLVVHLDVSGDLGDPHVSLDTRAQTRQLGEKKKDRLKEKLEDRLRDLLGGSREDDDEDR
jgi:autotransporter translocation and assembly factor TamB